MIKLKRIYVIIITLLLMVCIHFASCLYELIGKDTVAGKIISYDHWKTQHNSIQSNRWTRQNYSTSLHHLAPVAVYTVDNVEYQLQGPEVIDTYNHHETGLDVTILYSKRAPANAYFYTLTGFWLSNYLYWLIAFLVVVIAITTFMERSQLLIFRYSRSAEGLIFELTPFEEPSWMKRNAGRIKRNFRNEISRRQSDKKTNP